VLHTKKLDATELRDIAGEGVEARVQSVRVQVGSRRMAQRMGWVNAGSVRVSCLPRFTAFGRSGDQTNANEDIEQQVKEMESLGQTVCYLGVNGALGAIFGVADAPREGAKDAVAQLRKRGIDVVMLTGDRKATAVAIAGQLGVDKVEAELMPEDKMTAVRKLKEECAANGRSLCSFGRHGTVAMVGDGINDAAALAASDVGVAMGAAGTQVAVENAQVVLMDSDLAKLVLAIDLGRHAVTKIKQNLSFALVSKVVMVGLTLAGYASLWGAIAADLGAMLAVTLNASTVLAKRREVAKPGAAHGGKDGCCGGKDGGGKDGGHGHDHGSAQGHDHGHGNGHDHGHGHGHGH